MTKDREDGIMADEQPVKKATVKKKKKGSRSRTILIVLIIILVVLLAIAAAILTYTKPDPRSEQGVDFNATFAETEEGEPETAPPDAPTVDEEKADVQLETVENEEITQDAGWVHYLLLGVDGTTYKSGRSDAIIVLSVSEEEQRIVLSSIPRDTFAYIDGKGFRKINSAYNYGGADLTVKTFEENFDIDIQNYFVVNFASLPAIVDSIGGVTLTLTDAEAEHMGDYYGAWGLSGGKQVLNGKEVLAYCRVRKIDSDYKRNDRQFKALMAIYDKVKTIKADKYVGLAKSAFNAMSSDMMVADMLSLMNQVMGILDGGAEIEHLKLVDGENSSAGMFQGASIVMVDNLEDAAIRWRENLGIEDYKPSKRLHQISKELDKVLGR